MSVTPSSRELGRVGRLRSLADFYVTTMRTEIQTQFQYRAATYMYILGMQAEPVIYLVVWSTIADSSGGEVNGLTAGDFAAYYIVWTLVRTMNTAHPIRLGVADPRSQLSGRFASAHPIHYDAAGFGGRKDPVARLLPSDRGHPDADLQADVRRSSGGGRGLRDRDLGGVHHPHVQPDGHSGLPCLTTRVGALFSLYIVLGACRSQAGSCR